MSGRYRESYLCPSAPSAVERTPKKPCDEARHGNGSGSVKGIRVRVAVKCALRALLTLPRTRKRTLNRHPYPDTLTRTAYTIRPTSSHPSTGNPPLIPEAPFLEGYPQPRALPWAMFYDPVGVAASRVATRSSAAGQGIRDAPFALSPCRPALDMEPFIHY